MPLRFTCRECAHHWVQDTRRHRQTARCPNCGLLALAQGEAAPDEVPAEPGPSLTRIAAGIPTWGTSLMVHLALLLCSLVFAWSVVRPPDEPPPRAGAEVVRQIRYNVPKRPDGRNTPAGHSRRLADVPQAGLTFTRAASLATIIAVDDGQKSIGIPGAGGFDIAGPDGIGNGPGPDGRGTGLFPVPAQGDVVYIVDRSGSMTDSMAIVKMHLKRAIGYLRGGQRFHVIFYSSGQPQEMPTRALVRATDAHKEAALDFIDSVTPAGQTEPLEAFRRALALKPQRIIFLTDGEFDAKVADSVRDLNRRAGARIDTICFLYPTAENLLIRIAHENNGVYKYVGSDDLDQ
ncbi:MAG TPA: VWA domain-containing protein [Phycisphaerae bacterium]|nr:VWA domain-containing protein [Phycisphaerae bacterium]